VRITKEFIMEYTIGFIALVIIGIVVALGIIWGVFSLGIALLKDIFHIAAMIPVFIVVVLLMWGFYHVMKPTIDKSLAPVVYDTPKKVEKVADEIIVPLSDLKNR
jgi:hypothetical protein